MAKKSGARPGAAGWIYVVQCEGSPLLKIGYTTGGTVAQRLQELQMGTPHKLTLVADYACARAGDMKWFIHKLLYKHRRQGEWFEVEVAAIEQAFAIAIRNLDNPTFFMSFEEREEYEERCEERRNEALDEWAMFEHMELDAEEFVPIEPSPGDYPRREKLPPWFGGGKRGKKR